MARKPRTSQRLRRSRRCFNMVCVLILVSCVISVTYAVAQILPDYGQWLYAKHVETLDLGPVNCPSYLAIDIGYEDAPPENVQIELDGKWVKGVNIYDDVTNHVMRAAVDLPKEHDGQNVTLSLRPASNGKLTYDMQVLSSYEYISSEAGAMVDENGHKWFTVKAAYDNLREGGLLRIMAYLEGNSYKPSVYNFTTTQNTAEVCVDLTKIMAVRSVEEIKADRLVIYIGAEGTDADGNDVQANDQYEFRLNPYPKSGQAPADQSWTETYLDSVMPLWREKFPDWVEPKAETNTETEEPEENAPSPDNADAGTGG